MNVVVEDIGYVRVSLGLFAQKNNVTAVDTISEKVEMIHQRSSLIFEPEIEEYLVNKNFSLLRHLMEQKLMRRDIYYRN